jgi:hypothetical protein
MLRICNKNKLGPGSSWAQCSVELEITSCSTWQHIDVLSRIDWPSAAPASVGKTTLWPRVLFICPCRHNSPTVPASHNGCHRLKSPRALRPCQVAHSFFHGEHGVPSAPRSPLLSPCSHSHESLCASCCEVKK